MPRKPLFLYMLTNRKPDVQVVTQLGCCSDMEARMVLYNNPNPGPGSDRRARQAAGHWKPLLIIVLPASSQLSGRALVEQWKSKSRKIHCRFAYGMHMARTFGLQTIVDVDEIRADQRIFGKDPKLVEAVAQEVSGDPVASVEELLAPRATEPFSPLTLDGQSFRREDRPRERYKRKRQENAAKQANARKLREDPSTFPASLDQCTPNTLATVLNNACSPNENNEV